MDLDSRSIMGTKRRTLTVNHGLKFGLDKSPGPVICPDAFGELDLNG